MYSKSIIVKLREFIEGIFEELNLTNKFKKNKQKQIDL